MTAPRPPGDLVAPQHEAKHPCGFAGDSMAKSGQLSPSPSPPLYTPKGSMCMTCAHKACECKRLAFSAMPVIERWPGQVVVRCGDFVRESLKTHCEIE